VKPEPPDAGGQLALSHHGQETHLHLRPDTLTQTFLHSSTFPLHSDGEPYIAIRIDLRIRASECIAVRQNRITNPVENCPYHVGVPWIWSLLGVNLA
jgi:hypothetical protein